MRNFSLLVLVVITGSLYGYDAGAESFRFAAEKIANARILMDNGDLEGAYKNYDLASRHYMSIITTIGNKQQARIAEQQLAPLNDIIAKVKLQADAKRIADKKEKQSLEIAQREADPTYQREKASKKASVLLEDAVIATKKGNFDEANRLSQQAKETAEKGRSIQIKNENKTFHDKVYGDKPFDSSIEESNKIIKNVADVKAHSKFPIDGTLRFHLIGGYIGGKEGSTYETWLWLVWIIWPIVTYFLIIFMKIADAADSAASPVAGLLVLFHAVFLIRNIDVAFIVYMLMFIWLLLFYVGGFIVLIQWLKK